MSLMQTCTRADLQLMRRASLSHGRQLLSAESVEELAGRANVQFVFVGCGEPRVGRVEKIIKGRRRQVIELLVTVMPMEGAKASAGIIDSIAQMHCAMQSARAAEAMDGVLNAQ
jgi:hypothetical protein